MHLGDAAEYACRLGRVDWLEYVVALCILWRLWRYGLLDEDSIESHIVRGSACIEIRNYIGFAIAILSSYR